MPDMNEFENLEPGLELIRGDHGECYVRANMVGRGMTPPAIHPSWADPMNPIPFFLDKDDLIPTTPFVLRHVRISIKVKKGPGKGRHRSYWCIKSDRHKTRSELLPFLGGPLITECSLN